MKCRHCTIEFYEEQVKHSKYIDSDSKFHFDVFSYGCPKCNRLNIKLRRTPLESNASGIPIEYIDFIYPVDINRLPPPIEVPESIANDYLEACSVLIRSPKASAALSRRCVQSVLIDRAKVNAKDPLFKQIQDVIDRGELPSYLSDDIDHVREIGNFAAHPKKSTSSGEILEVEPGEAEWNLDTLEGLFDFYYVAPEKSRIRRKALKDKVGRDTNTNELPVEN